MKLFINIVMKKKLSGQHCSLKLQKENRISGLQMENFPDLQGRRKRGKSVRASPTPHHTFNEERSARFTAQPLSGLAVSYSEQRRLQC